MTAIELAPEHKIGLALSNPVMPAAGCFGLGMEYSDLIEMEAIGAIVVGPVTAIPRQGAAPPRTLAVPGGVLLHTGLANPGITAVVKNYGRALAHRTVRVIVHVAGTSPDEAASCCQRIAGIEAIAGIELGLPDTPSGLHQVGTRSGLNDLLADTVATIKAVRFAASQPLIVRLPMGYADYLCEAAVESGADALTVAAPPRGTAWHEPTRQFITGRLYGPFVLPLALRTLHRVAGLVSVPLIGCGGIHSAEDSWAFLRAGATAVQIGGAMWHDPGCLIRIARELSPEAGSD
jgi:dihydroorotate dehydrogenase (NAD+) catalytic subunit